MKVLLRKLDDKYYVWKDATWRNGEYYVDDMRITQIDILAVKDDNREKYVQCKNCLAIIKDDPESIEAHFAAEEAKKNCFECGSLRTGNSKNVQQTFVKNENGTYKRTHISDVLLSCSNTWPAQNINTIDLHDHCTYYRCRKYGVMPLTDMFIQHPNPFDKQITVDLLKAKGFEYEGHRNGYFEYDLKLRGTLKACVNELGIVDHFVIHLRYNRTIVYYADNYDELFYMNDDYQYTTDRNANISLSKHEAVKSKISALYKEATAANE